MLEPRNDYIHGHNMKGVPKPPRTPEHCFALSKALKKVGLKEKTPLPDNYKFKITINKDCASYLGCIAEQLLSKIFKHVKMMPYGNHGYDSVTITVNASGLPSSITLQANPDTVNAGGGDSTIIAYVEDAVGNPVTNGTVVNFSTNLGSLSSNSETTLAGIATTVLTLSNPSTEDTIYATVTAISSPAISDVTVTCPPTPAP